jgi:hypothetical protein
MTFLAAAGAVLRAANGPLTSGETTELALERGLITTTGKNPHVTMSARLDTAVKANPKARANQRCEGFR